MKNILIKIVRKINNYLLDFSYRNRFKRVLGYPSGIMFEPYSDCNYSCPLCPIGLKTLKREKREMSFSEFKRFLGPLKWTVEYITLYHFGEPFLSSCIDDIVEYCKRYNISVQISTNGSIFKQEVLKRLFVAGLDRLIISIDTPNENQYTVYRRGGNFAKVEDNIKKMTILRNEVHSNTRIVLQYMLMKDNEDVEKMQTHGKELGADEVLIKTVGIGTSVQDIESAKKFLPENDIHSRYSKVDTTQIVAKDSGFICQYVWKRMLVCSDGTCTVCVRDQKNEVIVGNLKEEKTLRRIWNNSNYKKVREKAKKEMIYPTMCMRCPEVLKYSVDPWVMDRDGSNCMDFKL
ncbi:MAG: radical SAM protein [Lachnospiraceae bacterium]|nr:radical SAM protein [Lachnospiraceae bacterium]